MDAAYWHEKWQTSDLGFDQREPNPLLVAHFKELGLEKGNRVFVPLCGRSIDMAWLLEQGYSIAGIELSKLAVEQWFDSMKLKPAIQEQGPLKHYKAQRIDLFAGDLFALGPALLGPVDAIYDRAAYVALHQDKRALYARHLISITHKAKQFLITFDYDQALLKGPPFSISKEELNQNYAQDYALNLAAERDVPGGLKRVCPATEQAWVLA